MADFPTNFAPGAPPATGMQGDTRLALRRVINAWGAATPFGVSRSDPQVAQAVADVLGQYVVMSDLQELAWQALAAWSGAPGGCVTHSSSAGITLAVAACMTGMNGDSIGRLPDTGGMRKRVLLLESHVVNYGQPITQAIRLSGAVPVVCASTGALAAELSQPGAAAVLAVESQLAPGSGTETTGELQVLARHAGVPLLLDGAAQDWRIHELVDTGADLVVCSAHKYLRAPTAGLVVGRAELVHAVDAQHAGIGRGMKPTKEAIAGVIAALRLRKDMDRDAWRAAEQRKVDAVVQAARRFADVRVQRVADPQGNGFDRLWLTPNVATCGMDVVTLIRLMRDGDPAVAVSPFRAAQGQIGLELTGVSEEEIPVLCERLAMAFSGALTAR